MEPTGQSAVIIFSGGPAPDGEVVRGLLGRPCAWTVIAADEGVDHALAVGFTPDVAIGDFDSVSRAGLKAVESHGAEVRSHPRDKDATDLELALELALPLAGGGDLVVVGSAIGRFDHLAAQVSLLASPEWSTATLTAHLGQAVLQPVHAGRPACLRGRPGTIVSLLPIGGRASGVTTTGLRFTLTQEELVPWSTRGVSNEFVDHHAEVAVGEGVIMSIIPAQATAPVIEDKEQS